MKVKIPLKKSSKFPFASRNLWGNPGERMWPKNVAYLYASRILGRDKRRKTTVEKMFLHPIQMFALHKKCILF